MRLYNFTLEVYLPDASARAGAIDARRMQRLMWRYKETGAKSAITWTVADLLRKYIINKHPKDFELTLGTHLLVLFVFGITEDALGAVGDQQERLKVVDLHNGRVEI